jgi:hypothetical protein
MYFSRWNAVLARSRGDDSANVWYACMCTSLGEEDNEIRFSGFISDVDADTHRQGRLEQGT